MARLNTTVHVYDGADTIVYLPGQEVPQKHREQITAPGVWEDGPEDPEPTTAPEPTPEPAPEPIQEPEPTPEPVAEPEPMPEALVIPPKAGRGSSADAWRDYAGKAAERAGLKIEFDDDAKRDDIITALEEAKIPTE